MNKPSIKKITLINLVRFFLILILILILVIAINFRNFAEEAVQNKAFAIAQIIKAGLTSHMKAEIMDKRDYFLQEISSTHEVDSIRIIRSDAIKKQFGDGNSLEASADDTIKAVFEKKAPIFIWNEFDNGVSVRAVVPYYASSKGKLSCIQCHHVPAGTVLGAIDMNIDITGYRDMTIFYILIIAAILLIFATFIIFNMATVLDRYIKKPLKSLINDAKNTYANHTSINHKKYESEEFEDVAKNFNEFNKNILKHKEELENKNEELKKLNKEIEDSLKESILIMGQIEAKRSKESQNHTKRVVKLSTLLAKKAGLSKNEIKLIETASPLHDIGKLAISDNILHKPSRLTYEEYEIMKTHTNYAKSMLEHSQRDILKSALIIAYQHHERWDGDGYPNGLKANQIHIFARIVSIVDVLDALMSKRAYKESWDRDKILAYFNAKSGKKFDPRLVKIFLDNFDEFEDKVLELSCTNPN